ncbi:DUF6350 family protein [Streptomyces sp. NPDC059828]|uniref:cell division protein PerM n=1 Tax=Streptomyces sp. NPDC059828 TaxID=3346965 RepID=UPI003662379D
MTHHSPVPAVAVQGARPPAVLFMAAVLRGVMAAGLGFGALAVPVILMWISSPYPDSGPRGALHVAAGLWLLAHGAELVRAETLSGAPAPVGVVPLLLVVLPIWSAHRAVRDTLESGAGARGAVGLVVSGVTCGYLLIATTVAMYSTGGALAAEPLSAALHLPAVTVLSATAGAWTACGRPLGPLPAWVPAGLRGSGTRTRFLVALRAAGAATATLVAGGALLFAASLAWHAEAAGEQLVRLAADWPGRFAVVVLALILVPNAAVWGAAYGLGSGFALGTAGTAAPLAVAEGATPPHFPLLAAVPAQGLEAPLIWACAAVPVAAGGAVAWCTSRAAREAGTADGGGREAAWGRRETAVVALLAAALCAVLMALLAAWAGGPLGTAGLADFGPVWWLTGAAAFGWTAAVGIPIAVGAHTWHMRQATGDSRPDPREVCWAASKRAVQGLLGLVRGVAGRPGPPSPAAGAAPQPVATVAEPEAPEQDEPAPPVTDLDASDPAPVTDLDASDPAPAVNLDASDPAKVTHGAAAGPDTDADAERGTGGPDTDTRAVKGEDAGAPDADVHAERGAAPDTDSKGQGGRP